MGTGAITTGYVSFMDRYESEFIAWISMGRGDYERSTEMSPRPCKKGLEVDRKRAAGPFSVFS